MSGSSGAGKNPLWCFAEYAETGEAILPMAWNDIFQPASSSNPERHPAPDVRLLPRTMPVYRRAVRFQPKNRKVPVE